MKSKVEADIENALLEGKPYAVIAKELRVSSKTIAKVAKSIREPSPSRVIKMFRSGTSPIDVVEKTDIDPETISRWFDAYVKMRDSWDEYNTREENVPEKDGSESEEKRDKDYWKRFMEGKR